MNRLNMDLP